MKYLPWIAIMLMLSSPVNAGSESSVEIQANAAKSELKNVDASFAESEALDTSMLELLGEGPKLSERVVEVETETTVLTHEDVVHAQEVQAQREKAEEYVAEKIERDSASYQDREGATHLMQIEGVSAGPLPVGRPVPLPSEMASPDGTVAVAGNGGGATQPLHPRLRKSVMPKLKGKAWEQLQEMAGASIQIEGTPEYISETARQGFDTTAYRNRPLNRSDVHEDRILKGYLPGVRPSSTRKMKFEDALNYFEWASDQRNLYQKQYRTLKRNLENQRYAMRSIYLPDSRTPKLADLTNELNKARNELPVLLSKKKQAESDRDYHQMLSKRHQQQSYDVSNMLNLVYKDWNALPRDNCTQGLIDGFSSRHGASVSKNETPQKTTWHLGNIKGKSDAQWRAEISDQWNLYLNSHNKGEQYQRDAGSFGYEITNRSAQIGRLESDLKNAETQLARAEEEWRKARGQLAVLAEDIDRYRKQFETLYNNTKELVIELRKASNEK
ncbi:MAG: hypothetical protein O3B01_09270 [Planctomycetota bacterium]|nr:hypothetical protein [Planctomycetota bacterium]